MSWSLITRAQRETSTFLFLLRLVFVRIETFLSGLREPLSDTRRSTLKEVFAGLNPDGNSGGDKVTKVVFRFRKVQSTCRPIFSLLCTVEETAHQVRQIVADLKATDNGADDEGYRQPAPPPPPFLRSNQLRVEGDNINT